MKSKLIYLIPLALTYLGMLALRKSNIKRSFRGRQILFAYLTPVISLLGVVAGYYYLEKYKRLDLIFTLEISPLYGKKPLLLNTAFILAFVVVKLIVCTILRVLWADQARMEKTCTTWYEYDEEFEAWFLRQNNYNLRKIFNVFSWLSMLICAAVLTLGFFFGPKSGWYVNVFPVAAMIIVTEIYNFLNGYTRQEYLHSVGGEGISSSRYGAYNKLRKIYESLFGSSLLVSHTGNEYSGKEGSTELLKKYGESDDPVEQIVGDYFSHLKKKNGLFDVDLVSATNALLHGKSTVIFNPFYRDLSDYLLLPLVNHLINNKKGLVIVGRGALCGDVSDWVVTMLKKYSRTRNLWRVKELTEGVPDCEVGVLAFSSLYNLNVIRSNGDFFKEVGFCILIEPSKMMSTAQSGLSIIIENMDLARPTFCIIDHAVDGLVDTMSHVLQTNITDVVAPPIPRSVYTAMGWSASGDFLRQKLFDKQTHYLGNGVELAAVALKNQVPHVTWYSAEKAPVQDIRWIAGQYYPQICRYAHLQNQQKSIDDKITFSSILWGSSVKKEEFVIAEDEFCNLFSTLRAYLTRGEAQSFVNVISENYLLRDYMRFNRQLFMTDPKAIPAIAPHYSKTERNTVLRLILMMVSGPVSEDYVAHELSLLNHGTKDVYKEISDLIKFYTFVTNTIISVKNTLEYDTECVPVQVCQYSITQKDFDDNFASTLKNAFFVVEDEEFEKEYIDARLFEHITQMVMPGQFLTHNGKQYRVHMVSPAIGCVLHRASDAYSNRYYYRQLRTYHFEGEGELLKTRKVMDVEVTFERRNFSVTTSGYLEMKDNQDLRTARLIDLSDDPCISTFNRSYRNKSVLRITLPDTDEHIRFTICMLLNETFRSVFPDAWPYLAVLSSRPADIEGMLDKVNYQIDGDIDENMIYVIEDSDMDLGLLEAVDNNLMRLFEIITDYLNWHFDKMKEPPEKEPEKKIVEPVEEEEEKKKGFFARLLAKVKKILGIQSKKDKEKARKKEKEEKKKALEEAKEEAQLEKEREEREKEEKEKQDKVVKEMEEALAKEEEREKEEDEIVEAEKISDEEESPFADEAEKKDDEKTEPVKADEAEKKDDEKTEPVKAEEAEKVAEKTEAARAEGEAEKTEAARAEGEAEKTEAARAEGEAERTEAVKAEGEAEQAEEEKTEAAETEAEKTETANGKTEKTETAKAEKEAGKTEPAEAEKAEAEKEEPAAERKIETPLEEQIIVHEDGEDLFGVDGVPDDLDILMPIKPSRYQKECFLKFGFDEIDSRLAIEDVCSYMTARGWNNNDLTKARKRKEFENTLLDMEAENFCDFCGLPLSGISYDRLADGRIRCNECSVTAINDVAEFKKVFDNSEMMMTSVFDITMPVNIAVRMADARTIAKHSGMVFKPTVQPTARVLGFAQYKQGAYSMFIENGSPRLMTINTVTHELTHIWQYINWNRADVKRIYRQNSRKKTKIALDIVYEGMAMWSSIQMLYAMGETSFAGQQEMLAALRTDVYGIGFNLYRERYEIERTGDAPAFTPFTNFPPIDPDEVRNAIREDK